MREKRERERERERGREKGWAKEEERKRKEETRNMFLMAGRTKMLINSGVTVRDRVGE